MKGNQKIMNFMHFHNSCTRNGDLFIFSIKTENDHKQKMLPHTIINTFKRCELEVIEIQPEVMVTAK